MAQTTLNIAEQDGVTVVAFGPDTNLDALHVDEIREALAKLVEDPNTTKVVLDFTNVVFMASQALGYLVTLRLKAARSETGLVIAGLRDTLSDVISITQIDKLYQIHATRDDAIAALNAG